MIIYLAADYARKSEMQGCRAFVEALGHKVVSTWIDNEQEQPFGIDGEAIDETTINRCAGLATADFSELKDSDTVLLFTTGRLARGGRHTEFGAALAMMKRIIIIGPRENVFQCASCVEQFDTWRAFAAWISKGYLN